VSEERRGDQWGVRSINKVHVSVCAYVCLSVSNALTFESLDL